MIPEVPLTQGIFMTVVLPNKLPSRRGLSYRANELSNLGKLLKGLFIMEISLMI